MAFREINEENKRKNFVLHMAFVTFALSMMTTTILPRGCRLIDFQQCNDERGNLSVAEGRRQVPFSIERVFWIYDVPEGSERGSHSHNECAEVVVPVHGSFDMLVDDGDCRTVVHMDSPHQGILIPPGVWCCLQNFAPGTVCVVFASHPYNAAGYTHNYDAYCESVIHVQRYDASMADEWNALVKTSKNGTFLLDRHYMDYHADRFFDCSLLFRKKGELVAALPSNYVEEEHTVYSHGGLTYGGLLLHPRLTAVEALEVFNCAISYYKKEMGAVRWIYKPMPYIYHRLPADEDLYALFRCNATLKARGVSSVIDLTNRLPMRELRRRGLRKAHEAGITFCESNDLSSFWPVLEEVLLSRHGRHPVHTLEEMERLRSLFPEQIRLFVALTADKRVVAGTVMFETDRVAHAQYIAASSEGRETGALDGLFGWLVEEHYADKPWFDFGISTEQGGAYLNEGLVFQKEGFGARAVVYDQYELLLTEQ